MTERSDYPRPAMLCGEGYNAFRGQMQCTAGTDAVHCKDGCSALRERLQCTASEMGKRDTENVSPIQDKRKGRKDLPLGVHYSLLL